MTGAPNNLGLDPFPDPVGHFRANWQAVRRWRRCGVGGGERVPPAPLGWYWVYAFLKLFYLFSFFCNITFFGPPSGHFRFTRRCSHYSNGGWIKVMIRISLVVPIMCQKWKIWIRPKAQKLYSAVLAKSHMRNMENVTSNRPLHLEASNLFHMITSYRRLHLNLPIS